MSKPLRKKRILGIFFERDGDGTLSVTFANPMKIARTTF
jgi:hypothetical protein